ncbi:hypothetical protein T484DRAFT_1917017, partial [Baffinella frigidus]
ALRKETLARERRAKEQEEELRLLQGSKARQTKQIQLQGAELNTIAQEQEKLDERGAELNTIAQEQEKLDERVEGHKWELDEKQRALVTARVSHVRKELEAFQAEVEILEAQLLQVRRQLEEDDRQKATQVAELKTLRAARESLRNIEEEHAGRTRSRTRSGGGPPPKRARKADAAGCGAAPRDRRAPLCVFSRRAPPRRAGAREGGVGAGGRGQGRAGAGQG